MELTIANIDIVQEMKKKVTYWPTTGIFAIRFATEICDCVNIYGYSAGRAFSGSKSTKSFRYHYFDNYLLPGYQETKRGEDKENPHKYNKEGEWIINMQKMNMVKLSKQLI